jgi:hypothetical protein
MRKLTRKSNAARETVLAELALMAEGRHPNSRNITEKFLKCPEYQRASKLLCDAIRVQSHRQLARQEQIAPPPGWLLPI